MISFTFIHTLSFTACFTGLLLGALAIPAQGKPTWKPTSKPITTEKIDDTTTPQLTPFGCRYEGNHYAPGETIDKGYDESSNWCHGTYCSDNGQIVNWDNWNCKSTTLQPMSTPDSTTIPEPTTVPGCFYKGKHYAPGTEISHSHDESSNWCYGTYCSNDGQILSWDKFDCKPTTSPPTTTPQTTTPPATTPPMTTPQTTTPETTIPPGCLYEGKHYAPGETIDKGYDESSNWCYGTYCSNDGQIISWDKFDCKPTTSPPTTTPQTTTPPTTKPPATTPPMTTPQTTTPETTIPPGCLYEGNYYAPGETIDKGYDESSNWCHGTYCGDDGQIINWDNWNCKSTTLPSMSTPDSTTIPEPTTAPGCFYKGQYYSPGAEISHSYDESSNWCYGTYCSKDGQVLSWDKFDCKPTTLPLTTTPETTIPQGCFHKGKYYAPGETIEDGYDKSSNWCYGTYCSKEGQISYWDNFNCKSTTMSPSTTLPPTKST